MKHILVVASLLIFSSIYAQIEIDSKDEIKQKEKAPKVADTILSTEVFVYSNWSRTNRSLTENEGLFGDTLGERANETGLDIWSFGIGLRSQFHKYLAWEGGISMIRNGEQYSFSDTDTSYQYENRYTYIGMPLKVSFMYGNTFQLIASAGIIPQMFVRYSESIGYVDSENNSDQFTNTFSSGYNTFVLSTVFNIGGQVSLGDKLKIFAIPEYRLQLNSSYREIDPYIHKARAFGVNLGLTYKL